MNSKPSPVQYAIISGFLGIVLWLIIENDVRRIFVLLPFFLIMILTWLQCGMVYIATSRVRDDAKIEWTIVFAAALLWAIFMWLYIPQF